MEIFVYRPGAERVEENFTPEELPALLADKSNVVWVDFLGDNDEQLEAAKNIFLNVFKFHPLTVEDCFETRNQPKVEAFPSYLYFIVHGVKPETDSTNFVTKELDCFLGDNFVVTFHRERFKSVKIVKQQIRASSVSCRRGAAYLMHQILDQMIDLYMPVIEDFDDSIDELEERIFKMNEGDNRMLQEIMDLRRSVARLKRISARQLDVLYRISHGEFSQIPENILPFYRDVNDHLQRISDLSENYRELVNGLFDIHFAVVSNRANEVMKTLAVVSAIILPLSLIAGIYGMNFKVMPELEARNGYFITVGSMALIAVLLLVYFWRRGWIFQKEEELKDSDEADKK